MPERARIHYAITDVGGKSPHVVQTQASEHYIVRATDTAQIRELSERMLKIAQGAALMTETELTMEFDGASSEFMPNETLEQALYETAQTLGGTPFNEAGQAAAASFVPSLDAREIRNTKASVGWSPSESRALHDELPAVDRKAPCPQLFGSTDIGDVSWVVPTVQILASTCAAGTALRMLTESAVPGKAVNEFTEATVQTPQPSPIPDAAIAPGRARSRG